MSDVCLKKKYKLALWSLAVLPWGIFSGAVMFAEKGDPWVVLTYAMILFFVVCFSYYRIKVSKAKVWRVVLEAVGLLMVFVLVHTDKAKTKIIGVRVDDKFSCA